MQRSLWFKGMFLRHGANYGNRFLPEDWIKAESIELGRESMKSFENRDVSWLFPTEKLFDFCSISVRFLWSQSPYDFFEGITDWGGPRKILRESSG